MSSYLTRLLRLTSRILALLDPQPNL
jgi:hypothetical protein